VCSNLADMLGFVRAHWLMWLRDLLVLLNANGYEKGYECCIFCLMWTWCVNVLWIGLLVYVEIEAGWAGKMPLNPEGLDERKAMAKGAKESDDCPLYMQQVKDYGYFDLSTKKCTKCGVEIASHLQLMPVQAQAAAAGTPPQSEVWCVFVIALLSWSYACLWSCDTWVEQGRRREVVNLERDRGPWLRRLRNSPLTNSFL